MIIHHRINTIEDLMNIPIHQGVELDVRGYGNKLFLTHDPIDDSRLKEYTNFEQYLEHFNHELMVLNVKEVGYEKKIIGLMEKYRVKDYFFQDEDFPYIYISTRREAMRKISIRFSEV